MMRGRGKSRGAAGLTRPHARDDDGKVISIPQSFDGPPPLYPVRAPQDGFYLVFVFVSLCR